MAKRSPLTLLFLTVTLDLIGFGMVVPLMPLYAERLAVSGHAIAWLLSSYSLMQFFFAPIWGRLSDRIGRRPVLLASIFVNALCLLGFALSGSYWQLLMTRLGAGICTANISVASAYVADVTTLATRARGMGAIGAAFGLGFVLGPFFAGELSPYGLMVPPLAAALLSLVNGLLAVWLLPESLPPARRRRPLAGASPWYRERWQALLQSPQSVPLFALVFLQVGGFAMMELALSLFCERRFGLGASGTGRLLALLCLVKVAVQGGLIGPVVRRVGEVRVVRWSLVMLAVALLAAPIGASFALSYFVGALVLVGASQGFLSPSLTGLISKHAAKDAQGTAMGLSQSCSALARTVGPSAAGMLLDAQGDSSPFVGAAVVVGCAAILSFVGVSAPLGAGGAAPSPVAR